MATCLVAVVLSGCGGGKSEDDVSRQDAEALSVKLGPTQPTQSASCVELTEERHFRCELRVDETIREAYEVIVSKDKSTAQFLDVNR